MAPRVGHESLIAHARPALAITRLPRSILFGATAAPHRRINARSAMFPGRRPVSSIQATGRSLVQRSRFRLGKRPSRKRRGQASMAAADTPSVIRSQNGPSLTISTCPGRCSRNHDVCCAKWRARRGTGQRNATLVSSQKKYSSSQENRRRKPASNRWLDARSKCARYDSSHCRTCSSSGQGHGKTRRPAAACGDRSGATAAARPETSRCGAPWPRVPRHRPTAAPCGAPPGRENQPQRSPDAWAFRAGRPRTGHTSSVLVLSLLATLPLSRYVPRLERIGA